MVAYVTVRFSGVAQTSTRDIRFIEAIYPDESVMVYRNEDTGWIWPPYFKYDSSNLQAEAGGLESTKAAPVWVAIKHYGWRLPILSIYPNAVSLREVAGPDVRLIPYFNIIFLTLLIGLGVYLRVKWQKFIARRVEPIVAEVQEAWDGVENRAEGAASNAGDIWARKKARPEANRAPFFG
ncbi:MAG: DUF1523 family protein [Cypionkella sp.]|nr:DUF1523 family protein [Cypionkella sp.]